MLIGCTVVVCYECQSQWAFGCIGGSGHGYSVTTCRPIVCCLFKRAKFCAYFSFSLFSVCALGYSR